MYLTKSLPRFRMTPSIPLLALTYFCCALAALALAIPPGYATAVYPPAGVAFAALLLGGLRLAPGVWLGSLCANLWIAQRHDALDATTAAIAAIVGLGAALQATLAAYLVRRRLGDRWQTLDRDEDIVRFLALGGPLACLASASVGTATLAFFRVIRPDEALFDWWTWWAGDTVGSLLFAPLTLNFALRDRPLWKARMRVVVPPVSVVSLGILTAFVYVSRSESRLFEQSLENLGNAFANRIELEIRAYEELSASLGEAIALLPKLSYRDFDRLTRSAFDRHPDLHALSWNPIVEDAERPGFEARMSREMPAAHFEIVERGPYERLIPAKRRPRYVAVTYIAPLAINRKALGYDIASDPLRRAAIDAAIHSGRQTATAPIRLVQETGSSAGLLLLQPVCREKDVPPSGFAVSVVRIENLLHRLDAGAALAGMEVALKDEQAPPQASVLYESENVPAAVAPAWQTTIAIGGRSWRLGLYPKPEYLASHDSGLSWSVLASGMALAGLLQTLLLGMTGRASATQRRVEEQTRELRERNRQLRLTQYAVDHSLTSIFLIDSNGAVVYVNDQACRSLGMSRRELSGSSVWDFDPNYSAETWPSFWQAFRRAGVAHFESRHRRKDGAVMPVEVTANLIALEGEGLLGIAFVKDIAERKRVEEKQRLIARVFETTQEGIVITDADCRIVEINEAFTRITGYEREEIQGQNPRILKSGRQTPEFYAAMWQSIANLGYWSGELWNRRKSGEIYPEWATISAIYDENRSVSHYVGIFTDIEVIKRHESQLEHIAHYDALTGIPNRVLLIDRMRQAIALARRERTLLAVCYLDLDGFKPVNDTEGHEAGDRVLIEIAQRIGDNLRAGDTVARLGGDEFVILLLDLQNPGDCEPSLERLLRIVAQPIAIRGSGYSVTASIGTTLFPLDDEDPDTLLRHADQAMYLAKQLGKNRYCLFDPDRDSQFKLNREHRERIERGLANGEFELHYQPKIAMQNRRVAGVEALIRWRHPQRGLLLPAEFLPYVENSELEILLGEWVIEAALLQSESWRAEGLDLEISVNISAAHLQSPDFAQALQSKLRRYPVLPRGRLQIEILETAALADIASVAAIIRSCATMGVSFALDDFGTGYSSLAYLRRLPADTLKIDQSFVRDMLKDRDDRAIVQGVIAMAKTFDRVTVAEGVETQGHFEALREMGCDIGQGYGIARPMRACELSAWTWRFADETGGPDLPTPSGPGALSD